MSIACVMAQAALPIPLLGPMSFSALCEETCNEEATVGWCQKVKLLRSEHTCSCGRSMHLVERRKAGKEGAMWRCPRRGCRKEVSLRKGTFFEGISFDDLCVMYYIFILVV